MEPLKREREWWGIRNIYIFNGQEFLPQLITDAKPQVQEAQGTRNRINTEKEHFISVIHQVNRLKNKMQKKHLAKLKLHS